MRSKKWLAGKIQMGAALAVAVLAAQASDAATLPPALPGGATNIFTDQWAYPGNGEIANGAPTNITDNDLDTTINGPNNYSTVTHVAVFAEDKSTNGNNSLLGTFGSINLIRLWGQGGFNGYGNGQFNGYVVPPNVIKIFYGYTGGNPANGYTITDGFFTTPATILSVNGAAPVVDGNGYTSLQNAYTSPNAIAATDNVNDQHTSYSVDLVVNIPAGANGIIFDLGPQASTSNGAGGTFVNEIQAANVPEPTGLGLVLLGGAALTLRRRRAVHTR